MKKKILLNLALPVAFLLTGNYAMAAESDAAPVFFGVQNITSSSTLGSASFTRDDFAVSAISQSDIANMIGSISMSSTLTTLNSGMTFGVSKNGFYAGGGAGFFMDSYAGSTATLYDKAGLTAIASATYKVEAAPVLINATYIYRLTGKVADTETSFSFGAGYKF